MTVEQLKNKYEKIRIESKELLKDLSPVLKRYLKLAKKSGALIGEIENNLKTLYTNDYWGGECPNGWDDSILMELTYLFDVPEFNNFTEMLESLKMVSRKKFKFTKNKENK